MRKLTLLALAATVGLLASSCLKMGNDSTQKRVIMTIYPTTTYSPSPLMGNVWREYPAYSDSDNPTVRPLANTILDGFDKLTFAPGKEYQLRVKKVWMKNPPMDVSSIKYVYLGTKSVRDGSTSSSSQQLVLTVAPQRVSYFPITGNEPIEALLVSEDGGKKWFPLARIEGFTFTGGLLQQVEVEKRTTAKPYSVRYIAK